MNDVQRKILIVGQAPGRRGDPTRPLEGHSFRRLVRWSGLSWGIYLARTERVNLFRRFPGKARPKGDRFNRRLARARAEKILRSSGGRCLILLGRNVARAFGLPALTGPFEWWFLGGARRFVEVAVVPHPSGISHFYNDPANRERAGRFLRAALLDNWTARGQDPQRGLELSGSENPQEAGENSCPARD